MKSLIILGILTVFSGGCVSNKQFRMLNADQVPARKFDIIAAADSRRYIPLENKTGNFNGFLTGLIEAGKYYYLTDNYSILK